METVWLWPVSSGKGSGVGDVSTFLGELELDTLSVWLWCPFYRGRISVLIDALFKCYSMTVGGK